MFSDVNEKRLYVQGVWEAIESKYLQAYPFLTDAEFTDLFGEEVLGAIAILNCPRENCGLCDIDIDCPFYSKKLDRCGIEPYKPVHCRLWHCYECGPLRLVKDIRELTAIFADQMGPEAEAGQIKSALERGEMSQDAAKKAFERLVVEFRNNKE
jgi:Fe-S-cluster containining protein